MRMTIRVFGSLAVLLKRLTAHSGSCQTSRTVIYDDPPAPAVCPIRPPKRHAMPLHARTITAVLAR